MEFKLNELPKKFAALPAFARMALLGGAGALAIAFAVVGTSFGGGEQFQYAFTNLSAEDSSDAAAALKASGIPFRLDANGAALAVPASKVYDARLLLAAAGLPRGGGVGFELFDRGDLGVSEFTQRVNLRRALEGELQRTISHLAAVRSARVHLTMGEKGLYREDDRKPSAAVVLNLQPGRTLGDKEVQGVRNLVANAVPGLSAEQVAIVDGKGTVLAADGGASHAASQAQREMERDLEGRIVQLLEPAVGNGSVIAKVSATLDASEVQSSQELYDPDGTVLRSERKVTSAQQAQDSRAGGVAGAAANQPLSPVQGGVTAGVKNAANADDQTRNFEISRTTTTTVQRAPRLKRLSVAVLLDGAGGKPRPDAEVARLGELAKRAVGFDAARGDVLEISSSTFVKPGEEPPPPAPVAPPMIDKARQWAPYAVGAVLLLAALITAMRRGGAAAPQVISPSVLKPGARVADIEAQLAQAAGELPPPPQAAPIGLPDPNIATQTKAREIATTDPARAAHLLKAWIQSDMEAEARDG